MIPQPRIRSLSSTVLWPFLAFFLPALCGTAWAVNGFPLVDQTTTQTISSSQVVFDCSGDHRIIMTTPATHKQNSPFSILLIGSSLFTLSSLHARRKNRQSSE